MRRGHRKEGKRGRGGAGGSGQIRESRDFIKGRGCTE